MANNMPLPLHRIMLGEELGVSHESGFRPSGYIVQLTGHKEQERDVGTELPWIYPVDVRACSEAQRKT